MEKSQTNLNAVRRFYDAYNNKDAAILNEVIADDYVDYGHEPPGRGLQGARNDQQEIARGLADARFDIDEMFGADDRVVVRWTVHGTHTGPFAGVPATQKKITIRGISLYRLRDGKITETRNLADLLTLFTQLGTIEQKQKAAASR
jgi:steroid delta-isomerase-like uncharacterized protein